MASTINAKNTSTGVVITPDASGQLELQTADTTRMTITSSGNVGIGTSNPNQRLQIYSSGATGGAIQVTNASTGASSTDGVLIGYDGSNDVIINNQEATQTKIFTSGTERMRIDSSGNVLVGATSALATNQHSFQSTSTSSAAVLALRNAGATAGLYWQVGPDSSSNFKVYNASNTGVFLANGGTSWSSSSDETLKENLVPIDNAIDKVMSLRTVIGNFIADENKQKRPFLIAQDVQKVFPEAISIAPEGTLGLAYSDMIPLLTAAIKELKAELDTVKAELATLKGTA